MLVQKEQQLLPVAPLIEKRSFLAAQRADAQKLILFAPPIARNEVEQQGVLDHLKIFVFLDIYDQRASDQNHRFCGLNVQVDLGRSRIFKDLVDALEKVHPCASLREQGLKVKFDGKALLVLRGDTGDELNELLGLHFHGLSEFELLEIHRVKLVRVIDVELPVVIGDEVVVLCHLEDVELAVPDNLFQNRLLFLVVLLGY